LTNGLVDVSEKKTFCIFHHLEELMHISSSDKIKGMKIHRFDDVCFTVVSRGKASKAVLRRIMLDIIIWLPFALSMFKTLFMTFFCLKQKWQSTLSGDT